jgi:mono/diheme cytochrome c family protein
MRLLFFILAALCATTMSVQVEPRSGAQLYQEHCSACHHPANLLVKWPRAGSGAEAECDHALE